ncbi:hypothetical protein PR048_013024, partial [Dryococelus australis]
MPFRTSGLIIYPEHPFFGALPDALFYENAIAEIKCPYSIKDMSPQEAYKGIFIDRIVKDTQFWEQEMVTKLTKFYWECLLEEILDSRKAQGHIIIDPESIENAKIEVAKRRKLF